MIILHAGFFDDQIHLWGEAPIGEAPESESEKRRAASRAKTKSKLYRYDAGAERLIAALGEIVPGAAIDASDLEARTVWLPTVEGLACASNALIDEPSPPGSKPAIGAWTVTTLPLTTSEAVDLLCRAIGRDTLAPGVIVGRSLAFWTSALRFAGALVSRQQFLPTLEAVEDFYRARWAPVIAGADARRLSLLAKTMPPVCRALSLNEAASAPDTPAIRVLTGFLDESVDYLVRLGNGEAAGRRKSFQSAHDRWLHALRASDGVIETAADEMAALAEQVREWRRPLAVSVAAPFRLCFRLEEPGEEEEGRGEKPPRWHVRYFLQATDDPSLLIAAADAWAPDKRTAAALKRGRLNPREYLLSALGQAAGLSSHIEQSLKSAAPGGYDLDSAGAHEFLSEKAWLLEQAGFGVMLPAWWTRKGTKLQLGARAQVKSPKLQGGGGLSLDQIIQFNWEVALGTETLSLKELEALARLKEPLVRLRGQWVELDPEEIQAALDFWKKKGAEKTTLRDVARMAMGKTDAPGGLAFQGISADGWIAQWLEQLDGRRALDELEVPAGFHGELRPYQLRGYSWLGFLKQWGLGACLADDMGLGKTIQALALIEREWHLNEKRPVLLVCPTSVIGNWQKEAARFTPDLPVMAHHGIARAKGAAFKKEAKRNAIVISSYALLQRDIGVLEEVKWAGVILDEAQNIKNPETKQSRAARQLKSDYRVALTGTPVENNVGDLWAIMEFLNPGWLGTQTEFKRNFFIPIQAERDPDATKRLQRLTAPFILRRLKTDKSIIADLPEKMEMKVFCTLTKEQASLYEAVVRDAEKALEGSEGIQRKGLVLATLSKLKQVCNHPAQFLGDNSAVAGRSGKLARLTEMLEEALATGERALIFSQFAEMGAMLQKHLQESFGQEALFLHGAVAKKKRDQMVERFQSSNGAGSGAGNGAGPRLFVLSLKAGGTGLNLTAANHVFHFDRWWNPAVENQATDRAFRIGQTRNVQVRKFLCAGTLEEKIDEMIENKQSLAASIVGAGEGWLTELSTKQLKELFALRKDAVRE
ncbi:MAG: DEAD/DEAH box helicase [Blastocatellia bacterium]